MRETKYWTWHMLAGVAIFVFLGFHMMIMHTTPGLEYYGPASIKAVTNPEGGESVDPANVKVRDAKLSFAIMYILLLGVALYHGLYGLKNILFELTLKPGVEKAISVLLILVGLGLFGLGTWAAIAAHAAAIAGRG